MSTPRLRLDCRLERVAGDHVLEFVAFEHDLEPLRAGSWPIGPGEIRASAAGAPLLMHFAPGRWLAPDPGVEARQMVEVAAVLGLGVSVDVTGKWVPMQLEGVDAARVLASTIDIRALLGGRRCAAAHLFDCPTIVATAGDGYGLWVGASYTAAFAAAIERQVACAPAAEARR
jgi:sarcosine oxidase gamma subunit